MEGQFLASTIHFDNSCFVINVNNSRFIKKNLNASSDIPTKDEFLIGRTARPHGFCATKLRGQTLLIAGN